MKPLLVVVGVLVLWVLVQALRHRLRSRDAVAFDDQGVLRRLANGTAERIRWDDLAEVAIVTTDEGPFADDDVRWVLTACDARQCTFPNDAQGIAELLPRLGELPGFDHEAVIRAMCSTSNDRFVLWRRASPSLTVPSLD